MTATLDKIKLTPPDQLEEVTAVQVAQSGPIATDISKITPKINDQVERFAQALLAGDVGSEEFRAKIDLSFSLGRAEIAKATELSNRFTKQALNSPGSEAANQAMGDMRQIFDELKPPGAESLVGPTKILGIPVPFGNKLSRYLQKFQSADNRINGLREVLEKTKDEMLKDVAELGVARKQIWEALGKLDGAGAFLTALDTRLSDEVENVKRLDPAKARAIEQEVLFYARQNLSDVQACQALAINSYNVLEVLQKTGRETVNGCDRVLTIGMAALTIAATLAKATGNQITAQKAISGSKQAIESLITQTGQALGEHVEATKKFASDPALGVQTLTEMFDKTFNALDAMDEYRSSSLAVMKTNNEMIAGQLKNALARIEKRTAKAPTNQSFELDI